MLLLSVALPAKAAPESVYLLWNDGKKAFEAGDYLKAIQSLEPIVQKHPAEKDYSLAHFYLGVAYLKTSQFKKAKDPLRYYANSTGNTLESVKARLFLIRTYIELQDFHAADLTLIEIFKRKNEPRTPLEMQNEAYILKARSLLGLNKDSKASQVLDSIKPDLKRMGKRHPSGPTLYGELHWLELKIQSRECARIVGKKKLDEGQTRQLMSRRGTCLLEAALDYKEELDTGTDSWIKEAADELIRGFDSYSQACTTPPPAVGKRTAVELKRYNEELVFYLKKDCREKYTKALEILYNWRPGARETAAQSIDVVTESLTKMKDRLL